MLRRGDSGGGGRAAFVPKQFHSRKEKASKGYGRGLGETDFASKLPAGEEISRPEGSGGKSSSFPGNFDLPKWREMGYS